jgi:hypothetical protein
MRFDLSILGVQNTRIKTGVDVDSVLEKKKERLKEKKLALIQEEKLLEKKKKDIEKRRIFDVGLLIKKSGLLELEDSVLIGALMEIKELSTNEESVRRWKEKSNLLKEEGEEKRPLIIRVTSSENEKSLEKKIRSLGFKFNKFRKEWYGYGNPEMIGKNIGEGNLEITEV